MEDVTQTARQALYAWDQDLKKNIFLNDLDYIAACQFYLGDLYTLLQKKLEAIGDMVPKKLEPLVQYNNLDEQLPKIKAFDSFGTFTNDVTHHPAYLAAGELIYQTGMMSELKVPGRLTAFMAQFFLSSEAGEAGHHCPMACSAGIIRVLRQLKNFQHRDAFLEKLTEPSFQHNYTGAQFITEIQGGGDVGLNTTKALPDGDYYRIDGEKWFCSNAGCELMFVTARFNESLPGTKGLGLFLVPKLWDGINNFFTINRLKTKIGTRSMATGEITFHGAYAFKVGTLEDGFRYAMNDVLHLSRIFNSFSVLAMSRRAYFIAKYYAKHRIAFSHPIIEYPLVQESLAIIKAENEVMLAGAFYITRLQDAEDNASDKAQRVLLRVLVNLQKFFTAVRAHEHIHTALSILGGNGAIETFSSIPRLLRDCIVCENWEGSQNVLQMQIYKDIFKYDAFHVFMNYLRGEINELEACRQTLDEWAQKLEDMFLEFKALSEALQILQINPLTEAMAIFFNAVALAKEISMNKQKKKYLEFFIKRYQHKFVIDVFKDLQAIQALIEDGQ